MRLFRGWRLKSPAANRERPSADIHVGKTGKGDGIELYASALTRAGGAASPEGRGEDLDSLGDDTETCRNSLDAAAWRLVGALQEGFYSID